MDDIIYFDNNSTTPLDPRVLEAMMPYLTNLYGNAASTHRFGQKILNTVNEARDQVANLIHANKREIIFTSGATEGINLAMKGALESYSKKGKHVVTVATEHSAVMDTAKFLKKQGYEITFLPVREDGIVEIDTFKQTIRDDTSLVCVMYINNETGVIQPIKEIAHFTHEKGALFMTDGTQAVGKIPIDVNDLDVDLMPFSGHKFYGPKGIGSLYVRNRSPFRLRLQAILHGGGHERGMRSGTLNVPGIVGLGKACELAKEEMATDELRIGNLRDTLETLLLKIPNTLVNGSTAKRLYNITNIRFQGADADAIMVGLGNIAVSNGSACTATSVDPSHVLTAMGRTEEEAFSSIRFSLGRFNTEEEVLIVYEAVKNVVKELRAMVL